MIQIAICDDEQLILNMIRTYIESFHQKYALELNVCSYSEGRNLLASGEKYDIIFLDIGLGEEDGIEIGKEIRKMDKKVKIIYVTAFTDHMKDAFGVHAFEYLTKPVSEDKVHKILLEATTYDGSNVTNSMIFQTKNGMVTFSLLYHFLNETQDKRYPDKVWPYLLGGIVCTVIMVSIFYFRNLPVRMVLYTALCSTYSQLVFRYKDNR